MPSSHREPRPTLQTLATRLGISKTSVSYALRNDPRYSEELRMRVRELADELGYRPNPMVSALMAGRMRHPSPEDGSRIVVMHGHTAVEMARSVFGSRVMRSLIEHARRRGYEMEIHAAGDRTMSQKRLVTVMGNRGIRGLIVAYFNQHTAPLEVDLSELSCAGLQLPLAEPRIHHAENDHYEIMRLALNRLTEMGYERIGVAMPQIYRRHMRDLYRAALAMFQDELPAGQRVPMLELELNGPLAHPAFQEVFRARGREWLEAHRPDVVLSLDPVMRENLEFLGYRVPDEVACASLDILPGQEGAVAGVVQDYDAVSAAAVTLVHEQLINNERGLPRDPKLVLLRGRWLDGASAPGRR